MQVDIDIKLSFFYKFIISDERCGLSTTESSELRAFNPEEPVQPTSTSPNDQRDATVIAATADEEYDPPSTAQAVQKTIEEGLRGARPKSFQAQLLQRLAARNQIVVDAERTEL